MFDGLVAGRLIFDPNFKPSKGNGKPQASVAVAGRQLNGEDAIIKGFTQNPELIERLRTLKKGDSICLSGEVSLSEWNGKPVLTMRVHALLTAFHAGRKRKGAEVEG